ncbi:hypothetical protein ABK040_013901 [Willaertia magna]
MPANNKVSFLKNTEASFSKLLFISKKQAPFKILDKVNKPIQPLNNSTTEIEKKIYEYHLINSIKDKEKYKEIISNIKFITTGRSHILLITNDNELYTGGYNAYYQCGIGDEYNDIEFHSNSSSAFILTKINYLRKLMTDKNYYNEMDNKLFEITKAACGWVHSVIVVNDRYLFGCGHNYFYQTGLEKSSEFTTFQLIENNLFKRKEDRITHIDCGTFFTVIVVNNISIFGCGSATTSNFGLQNHSSGTNIVGYQHVCDMPNDILKVACGYDHTVILLVDHSIYVTGKLEEGKQVGTFKKLQNNIIGDDIKKY